ncbi:MAG: hypothetical protein DHS20C18_17940 [Saprospiraceae bacterium]|nr:MAG: hypothetical protein DHS20C18_17940 [Saprospiraceae bacterium]
MLNLLLKIRLSAFALGVLFCYTSYGQEENTNKLSALISCTNDFYGTDDYLVSGRSYQSSNPRASGHANFQFADWEAGEVYVQGKLFEGALLKYDIEKDVLVLKRTLKNGAPVQLILNRNMVDSFRIDGHLFVPNNQEKSGYLELIYQGGMGFYQKHKKKYTTDTSISSPYGKFIDENSRFYIFTGQQFHEISSRNDLLSYFADHKKELKKFMRQNKIQLQRAEWQQLYTLFKYVDGLL